MPILGLFPSAQEQKYQQQVNDLASGRRSTPAAQGIQRSADSGRKAAFAQAYQSRGNQALAQRQAQEANTAITHDASMQTAAQRSADQLASQAEQNRLEAQRQAGIHNAIGIGAQAAGMLGGPVTSAAAGQAAQGVTGALAPPPATQASAVPAQPPSQPNVMSLVQGANAPRTQPGSDMSRASTQWATSGGQQAPDTGTQGLTFDPSNPLSFLNKPGSSGFLLSDERMKQEARNGNPDARRFLDALSASMAELRQTLPADLQANADKAIREVSGQDRVFDRIPAQSFEYSPEGQSMGGASGPQLGIMAQDMEQVAPQMVRQGPDGTKSIDIPQAVSASLAAQANLNQRLNDIESAQDPLAGVVDVKSDYEPSVATGPAVAPPSPRVDLYNRPGNQRDVRADSPPRARRGRPSAEEQRYQENHRFLMALRDQFRKREATPQLATSAAAPTKSTPYGWTDMFNGARR